MDLYQLKAFYHLARVGSFTRTARVLGVTQSAVSHSIKKLEGSLDTDLVDRTGRGFALTRAGELLFESCEAIFRELERADEELSRYRERAVVTVTVGAPVEFGTTILIRHIRGFLDANPHIHLDFHFSDDLLAPLLREELDFIIDCKRHEGERLEEQSLFQEQYVCIASPDYIAAHRIADIADLERVRVLSLDKRLEWWTNFLAAVPPKRRPRIRDVVRINRVRGLINGAIAGIGVGFVPRYTVLDELRSEVLIDPFPAFKPEADRFRIYVKPHKRALAKNAALIDYLARITPEELGG